MSYLEPSEPQELLTQATPYLEMASYPSPNISGSVTTQISNSRSQITKHSSKISWPELTGVVTYISILERQSIHSTTAEQGSIAVPRLSSQQQANPTDLWQLPYLQVSPYLKAGRIHASFAPGPAVESVKQATGAYTEELKSVVHSLDRNHPINQFP